jgi:hypothetical protein
MRLGTAGSAEQAAKGCRFRPGSRRVVGRGTDDRSGRIALVRTCAELTSAFRGIRASLSPVVSDVILRIASQTTGATRQSQCLPAPRRSCDAWIPALSAALALFHRGGREAAADRAPAHDWISSAAGARQAHGRRSHLWRQRWRRGDEQAHVVRLRERDARWRLVSGSDSATSATAAATRARARIPRSPRSRDARRARGCGAWSPRGRRAPSRCRSGPGSGA